MESSSTEVDAEAAPPEIEVIRCGKLLVQSRSSDNNISSSSSSSSNTLGDGFKWKKRFCALKQDELGLPVLQVYKIRSGDALLLAFQIELRAKTAVEIYSIGNKFCFSIAGEVFALFHEDERDHWVTDIHENVLNYLASVQFTTAGGTQVSSTRTFEHDESFDNASVASQPYADELMQSSAVNMKIADSFATARSAVSDISMLDRSTEPTSAQLTGKKRTELTSKGLTTSFTGAANGPIRKGETKLQAAVAASRNLPVPVQSLSSKSSPVQIPPTLPTRQPLKTSYPESVTPLSMEDLTSGSSAISKQLSSQRRNSLTLTKNLAHSPPSRNQSTSSRMDFSLRTPSIISTHEVSILVQLNQELNEALELQIQQTAYERDMLLQQIGAYKHDIETLQDKVAESTSLEAKMEPPVAQREISKPDTADDDFWLKSRIEDLESLNRELLHKLEKADEFLIEKDETLAKLSSQIVVVDEDRSESNKRSLERLTFLESQYVVVESENRLLVNENKKLKDDVAHLTAVNESIGENFQSKIESLLEWKAVHEVLSAEKDQQLLQLKAYEEMSVEFDEVKKSLHQKDADIIVSGNQVGLLNKEIEDLNARIGSLSLENVEYSVKTRDLKEKLALLESNIFSKEQQYLADVRRLGVEIENLKCTISMSEASLQQKSFANIENERYIHSIVFSNSDNQKR
jgi:hypothetical protein